MKIKIKIKPESYQVVKGIWGERLSYTCPVCCATVKTYGSGPYSCHEVLYDVCPADGTAFFLKESVAIISTRQITQEVMRLAWKYHRDAERYSTPMELRRFTVALRDAWGKIKSKYSQTVTVLHVPELGQLPYREFQRTKVGWIKKQLGLTAFDSVSISTMVPGIYRNFNTRRGPFQFTAVAGKEFAKSNRVNYVVTLEDGKNKIEKVGGLK